MSENLNLNLVIRTYKVNKLNLDFLKSQSNLSILKGPNSIY